MRIGITCYATYGGSGVIATELGKYLVSRGHEIHFISSDLPFRLRSFNGKFLFHEVEVVTYPLFEYHQPYALNLAAKMSEVITYQKLDIMHAHYAIPHSISAILARQIINSPVKVITTLHGTDITIVGNEPAFLPVTQFGINESDGVTAVSQFLSDQTHETFDIKKNIRVIHNFVDTEKFIKRPDRELKEKYAPDNEFIVTHMSNFRPVKRVDTIIEIFSNILEKVKAKLLLIGDGPERGKAEKMCRELGICDHTIFLGKRLEVEDFLSISDLLISASEVESFGLSILEAMSCGVPIISSNTGGVPEIIVDGEQGFLLKPDDVSGFADAGIEILSKQSLQKSMSESGSARARALFDVNTIGPEYEQYYNEIYDSSDK